MLTLTGTSRERGRQHGESRREAIRRRVEEAVLVPAAGAGHRGGAGVDLLAGPWLRAIRDAAPDVVDEIHGIAEASGSSNAEIVVLNAFEAFEVVDQVELGGCTAVAFARAGGSIVAQNWDANPDLGSTVEVQRHEFADGRRLALLASPGGLGWIGMNDAGLALVTNDLVTRGRRVGVPSQVMRRMVLAKSTVAAAVSVLRRHPSVGGRTYLLGDAPGHVAAVELACEAEAPAVLGASTTLAHTNHAIDSGIRRWEAADLVERIYPSTRARFTRASALAASGGAATVPAILADHDGYPASVCHHEGSGEPTHTAASAIFDCERRVASFAIGNPCTNSYVEVTL
jgi:isopenicillin-N N-acyltransferase-like protein